MFFHSRSCGSTYIGEPSTFKNLYNDHPGNRVNWPLWLGLGQKHVATVDSAGSPCGEVCVSRGLTVRLLKHTETFTLHILHALSS